MKERAEIMIADGPQGRMTLFALTQVPPCRTLPPWMADAIRQERKECEERK